jgi:gamma-glutamylputrescine oxidase
MRSLWTDPDEQHYPALEEDREVDLAIVGAGLSGIGAAFAVRDSGRRIVVLEERTLASGASGRNGGFVLAGPAMSYDQSIAGVGEEEAERVWSLTVANNRTIAGLVEDHGISCGYLRRGSMSLAASDAEWQEMKSCLSCLTQAEHSACLVSREELPRPYERMYAGGIYYGGNAEMDPGRFLRGVASLVSGSVAIHERTPVIGLSYDGCWHLRTPGGVVRAASVLLATNAYTGRFLPAVPIVATRGQVLATDPVSRPVVPFPLYANAGYQYWRQTEEGHVVVGGWRDLDIVTEVGDEERLHTGIQTALDEFSRTIVPEGFSVRHRWAGIMGFTPDMLPLVGPVPGQYGLHVAAGYSGHGVSMAFTCGGRAARQALGESSDVPLCFSPGRYAKEWPLQG